MVLQNVIAMMYDCDMTLTPVYMQDVLFEYFKVDGNEFWQRKEEWQTRVRAQGIYIDDECAYMNMMLQYVREGKFRGLSNALLEDLGRNLPVYSGLPDFFKRINTTIQEDNLFKKYDISLEHYIISTGMKTTIFGSVLGKEVNDIFASEFYEEEKAISGIGRAIGYAKKTEFLHLINKGGNVDRRIDVNSFLPREFRRVPFEQMVYVGDGPTDVSCFATLNHRGGKSIAVYNPLLEKAFAQAYQLQEEKRVFTFAPADYREGSHLSLVLEKIVNEMAQRVIDKTEREWKGVIKEPVRL